MKRMIFFVALLLPFLTQAQTISTYAGGGGGGLPGSATASILSFPVGGAFFKKTGCYYFACSYSGHKVCKVDPAGNLTIVAGNGSAGFSGDHGPATAAQLNTPEAVILDTFGNIYISDAGNNRIRKIDTSGIITTIAGNGTMTSSGDGDSATHAGIYSPSDICFDKQYNLYIAEFYASKVRKVNTSGIITTVAGTGVIGYSGDGTYGNACMLGRIVGLATDTAGNLYIADNYASRIFRMNGSGYIFTFAGTTAGAMFNGDGMPATASNMDPYKMMTDDHGNVYLADYHNYRVRKIDASGIVHTVAGIGAPGFSGDGGGPLAAKFNYPAGLAYDTCGNLYVADAGNGRIRKIAPPHVPDELICTAAAHPSGPVCGNKLVNFTVADSGGSVANTYQWYVNGIPVATGGNSFAYSYYPVNGDSVRCVVTSGNPCSGSSVTASSNTINMTVLPPTSTPTVTLTAPAFAMVGATVTVNAMVAGAGSSYMIRWRRNGSLFSTTTTPTTTYIKAAGVDIITATVTSTSPGCYDTATSTIKVQDKTGVDLLTTANVSVWPNPATSTLYINSIATVASVTVATAMGQVVLAKECNTATPTIDIANLPTGAYILQITATDGYKTTTRLMKQ